MAEDHRFKVLLRAAELEDAEAQYYLGTMYYTGDGVEKDYSQALRWFRLAALQGHTKAQFNVGGMYYNGTGIAQDYGQAAKWFRRAAKSGDTNSKSVLGLMYYYGEGVAKDAEMAAKWFREMALSGYEGALYEAASSDMEGFDTLLDFEQCYCWLLIAGPDVSQYAEYAKNMVYTDLSQMQRDRSQEVADRWLQARSADQREM